MESVVSVQRTVKMSNKDVQQILFSLVVLSLQFTSVFKGVLPAAGLPSLSSSLKRWRLWKSPNVTIVGWASDVYNMLLETLLKRLKGWKLWTIRRYVFGIIFRCPQYAVGGILLNLTNSILITFDVLQQVPNLSPLSGLQVGRPPFWEALKVLSGCHMIITSAPPSLKSDS